MSEIIYGVRKTDGKVISIEEVSEDMPGLSCMCVCAYCGRDLQACSLKSVKVSRYFRHQNTTNSNGEGTFICNPIIANETALHKMAKQIIAEEKKILVPSKTVSCADAGLSDLPDSIVRDLKPFILRDKREVTAQLVETEKYLGNFTPDVVMTTNRGELLIEIFVRHKVDEIKITKVREYGAAMMEINLSNIVEDAITNADLRNLILCSEKNKSWKYYPVTEKDLLLAKNYYENIDMVKECRAKVIREKARGENLLSNKKRRDNKIKYLFEPSNYRSEVLRLRSDVSFLNYCSENKQPSWFDFEKFYEENQSIPFFIDIPISGEMIFQCDRRIWQSVLFNRYVYGRKEKNAKINLEKLFDDLKNDHQIKIDYDLTYKLPHPILPDQTIWLRKEVVKRYMYYLEVIGFISSQDQDNCWSTVSMRREIQPPYRETADVLKRFLQNIDQYSPNIDRLIDEELGEYFDRELQSREEEKCLAEYRRQQNEIAERLRKDQEIKNRIEKEKIEKEKRKNAELQRIYDLGFREVSPLNFNESINRFDKYNNRWVKCKICMAIKREYEMIEYNFGMGTCRSCQLKKESIQ
ncbi:MAG: hypothetical protein IKB28_04670 [Clostridia bacterium]|nr:hypothetical protein [Clostridia bacterium]